jgi:hypothetical protein
MMSLIFNTILKLWVKRVRPGTVIWEILAASVVLLGTGSLVFSAEGEDFQKGFRVAQIAPVPSINHDTTSFPLYGAQEPGMCPMSFRREIQGNSPDLRELP